MDRDIESAADARVESFIAAIEALADLMATLQPGMGPPNDRMAGLLAVLAMEGRTLHAEMRLTPSSRRLVPMND